VGGASRSEKKRRQKAAAQRLAAAGITPPRRRGSVPVFVVVAVLAVALVAGLLLWLARGAGEAVAATYPVASDGGVVIAGQTAAPVAVDVYSDYMCLGCERFEKAYRDELTEALNAGQIVLRYHPIAILDDRSSPAGYSTRAANAALCAAPAGIFPSFHDTLFAEQPAQGSAGLTDDQLVGVGTTLGATGDFAGCVRAGANQAAVAALTRATVADQALRHDGAFGTPTVTVNGGLVDVNDTAWLQSAIAAG
jgi:protein-disulfide isomerase